MPCAEPTGNQIHNCSRVCGSVCLCAWLFACLFVSLPVCVCLFACLFVSKSVCLCAWLGACLFVRPSVCVCVWLFACLSVFVGDSLPVSMLVLVCNSERVCLSVCLCICVCLSLHVHCQSVPICHSYKSLFKSSSNSSHNFPKSKTNLILTFLDKVIELFTSMLTSCPKMHFLVSVQ